MAYYDHEGNYLGDVDQESSVLLEPLPDEPAEAQQKDISP